MRNLSIITQAGANPPRRLDPWVIEWDGPAIVDHLVQRHGLGSTAPRGYHHPLSTFRD
jgi:hypothetical protein